MNFDLIVKLDELINIFENSDEIKELVSLKKEIYEDIYLKDKIDKFNRLKDNPYSNELISIKKEILDISDVKRYKELENELLLLTFEINKKLNSLINKKRCNHENN